MKFKSLWAETYNMHEQNVRKKFRVLMLKQVRQIIVRELSAVKCHNMRLDQQPTMNNTENWMGYLQHKQKF
jgi:hypothetical protein